MTGKLYLKERALKNMIAVVLLASLAACSTTAADLTYVPTLATAPEAKATVSSVIVTDARDEHDPYYVGAIRGGYGNPLKTLTTTQPIKDEVASAFVSALKSRGLYGASGPVVILVKLTQLSANWLARREGHTTFTMTVNDRGGGVIFQDEEDVLKIAGSLITFDAGIFASIDDLRAIATLSLNTAIDQALDKPAFRSAISGL